MKKSMNDFLSTNTSKLYRFAYSLIPDELQAEQLVVDAIGTVLREQHLITMRLMRHKDRDEVLWPYLMIEFYRHIFTLSCKRWGQVEDGVKAPRSYELFYHLTLSDRALLFLSNYGHCSWRQLADIIGVEEDWVKNREEQLTQMLYQEIMVSDEDLKFAGVYE